MLLGMEMFTGYDMCLLANGEWGGGGARMGVCVLGS